MKIKHPNGKLRTLLRRTEFTFWREAVNHCQPPTVRSLGKYAGVAPATVSRRLRQLGFRFEIVLVKRRSLHGEELIR